jgi:hypothetical protein
MTIVAALLIGAFHTGLMCYKKTDAYEKSALKLDSALSFIRADLRRFVPVNDKNIIFKPKKMSFYALAVRPESHLELISYSVEKKKLKRSVKPYSSGVGFSKDSHSAIILSDLDFWDFAYINSQTKRNLKKDGKTSKSKVKSKTPGDLSKSKKQKSENNLYWPSTVILSGSLRSREKTQMVTTSLLMPFYGKPQKSKLQASTATGNSQNNQNNNESNNENSQKTQ